MEALLEPASPPTHEEARPRPRAPLNKVLAPVHYSAWLNGDLGAALRRRFQESLAHLQELRITRVPRGWLIEADEEAGPLVESVLRALRDLEDWVDETYPVFHHEFGPVWAGTLQSIFSEERRQPACA